MFRIQQHLRSLHRDDRGGIGILLMMTVWSLVALIGMAWNSAEYAARHEQLQNAADSAAHSAATWMARTANLASATNMLMCENGSAEVIWRSIKPTSDAVRSRLTSEQDQARKLLDRCEEILKELQDFQDNKAALTRKLADLAPRVRSLAKRSLDQNAATAYLDSFDKAVQKDVAGLALLDNVPSTVQQWLDGDIKARLLDIISTIDQERAVLDQFDARTAPALSGTDPREFEQKQEEIYQYQTQIVSATPGVVARQRQDLASFYKCNLTQAVPVNVSPADEPAPILAPVRPAEAVSPVVHSDSIRQRHPDETQARFGSADPTVVVDPINVNLDNNCIWHPGTSESVPPTVSLDGKTFREDIRVWGDEWGQIYCAPLVRYFENRVWRDAKELRTYMQSIDQLRSSLLARLVPIPAPPPVPPPPAIVNLPRIPAPPDQASAAIKKEVDDLNREIDQFNQDLRACTQALQALPSRLSSLHRDTLSLCNKTSATFADWDSDAQLPGVWPSHVEGNRILVLRRFGDKKQFMVLRPYALGNIPDWARDGMWQSVYNYIYNHIYQRNIRPATDSIRSQLENWAYGVLLDQYQRQNDPNADRRARNQARSLANSMAASLADPAVTRGAMYIAAEVADEWVLRPWPFEIAPPPNDTDRGLTVDDRHLFFTLLAAAQSTDESRPRRVLPGIFGADASAMSSYAQAEVFNWMEFNHPYGPDDAYDRLSSYGGGHACKCSSYYRHGFLEYTLYGGSPPPWRLSTIGGWNWNPRLAFSDALAPTMETNTQFRRYFQESGVTGYDPQATQTITMH